MPDVEVRAAVFMPSMMDGYAAESSGHGSLRAPRRYCIVNKRTGEILDNANGYGYKTQQKAYAAWACKSKTAMKKNRGEAAKAAVTKWLQENSEIVDCLEDDILIELRGGMDAKHRISARFVERRLLSYDVDLDKLGFTVQELIKYW